MFRLVFALIVGLAAGVGLVNRLAREQARGAGWPVAAAVLLIAGGVAGFFVGSAVVVGTGETDAELASGELFLLTLAGGALLALPVLLALLARRPDAVGGHTRSRLWARIGLGLSVPVALTVVAAPIVAVAMVGPGAPWITEDLPDGIDGWAAADHALGEDFAGTVVVDDDATLDCAGHRIHGDAPFGVLLEPGARLVDCVVEGFEVAVAATEDAGIDGLSTAGVAMAVLVVDGGSLDCDGGTIRGKVTAVGVGLEGSGTVANCDLFGFGTDTTRVQR